jgi:LuxR family maltose regulon positive regulatory protein
MNEGLQLGHKLTLISAPADFGKTTLLSAWIAENERPAAWLSLDAADNDPLRFWRYVVAALRTVPTLAEADVGTTLLSVLTGPQPPAMDALLTGLLNEIAAASTPRPPGAG